MGGGIFFLCGVLHFLIRNFQMIFFYAKICWGGYQCLTYAMILSIILSSSIVLCLLSELPYKFLMFLHLYFWSLVLLATIAWSRINAILSNVFFQGGLGFGGISPKGWTAVDYCPTSTNLWYLKLSFLF